MGKSTCKTPSCERAVVGRGWCRLHYERAKAKGLFTPTPKRTVEQRLKRMFQIKEDGCWEWTGYRSPDGYGRIRAYGETRLAHRMSYELFKERIPSGLFLDHKCFNRACINPEHLRPVTNKQNMEHIKDLRTDNTTGARNVYWCKQTKSWAVVVGHNGTRHWGGRHATFAEADDVAQKIRRELFTHDDYEEWEQAKQTLA